MKTRSPTIEVHDSGLVAEHDQACCVCQHGKALLEMGSGRFQPCSSCQREGWRVQLVLPSLPARLGALPCWLLVRFVWPTFPVEHAWKARGTAFTLRDWTANRTDMCRGFDAVLWSTLAIILLAALL